MFPERSAVVDRDGSGRICICSEQCLVVIRSPDKPHGRFTWEVREIGREEGGRVFAMSGGR
jgi:hypothetical protein